MAYISPMLTNIVTAVKKASVNLNRDFSEIERLQNSVKGSLDFTKIAFDKVEKGIRIELAKVLPALPVMLINDKKPKEGMYLCVSALEGIANFAHGNADFAVSVALIEHNIVTAAVVYSPISDELFFAEKGSGAFKEGFRNHERLRVAGVKNIDKALLACNADINVLQKAVELSPNVSINGSVALSLAYVAAGKLDAVIANKSYFAELAAGILLVKEAGGYVFSYGQTDIRSEDLNRVLQSGSIVATNEALKQKLASEMAK